jgi:hypothetical protein
MENANVNRSLKRTMYSLTRRYGEPAYIYRVTENNTDYATGVVTRTATRAFLRNVVRVPSITSRSVMYTAAMMQTLRPMAWQGHGQDTETTTFLILKTDLRGWCEILPDQWISYKGDSFKVRETNEFDGGWICHCVIAKGSGPSHWEDLPNWEDCNHWSD